MWLEIVHGSDFNYCYEDICHSQYLYNKCKLIVDNNI